MKKDKDSPFNPLDKANLGASVANAILSQKYFSMPPNPFNGVGIYAIYYFGDNPIYRKISEFNRSNDIGWPVYIGKAISSGGRKGNFSGEIKSKNLFRRIAKHSETIKSVDDLQLQDFKCKFLTIDSIWIPLGEQLLIRKYQPVWNSIVDGFGNNDPGKKRYGGQIPDWHRLHKGVKWVSKMENFDQGADVDNLVHRILKYQDEYKHSV